MIGNEAQNWYQ